jgi:hypothetical protein
MRPFATRSAIVVSAFRPAVTAVTVDRLTVRSEIDQTQSRRAVTLIALGVQCSPSCESVEHGRPTGVVGSSTVGGALRAPVATLAA